MAWGSVSRRTLLPGGLAAACFVIEDGRPGLQRA
jgi:hypothetical protein